MSNNDYNTHTHTHGGRYERLAMIGWFDLNQPIIDWGKAEHLIAGCLRKLDANEVDHILAVTYMYPELLPRII